MHYQKKYVFSHWFSFDIRSDRNQINKRTGRNKKVLVGKFWKFNKRTGYYYFGLQSTHPWLSRGIFFAEFKMITSVYISKLLELWFSLRLRRSSKSIHLKDNRVKSKGISQTLRSQKSHGFALLFKTNIWKWYILHP